MGQWLSDRLALPLIPLWVIGGSKEDIQSKSLSCTSKCPTLVDTSQPLDKEVVDVNFGHNVDDFLSQYER